VYDDDDDDVYDDYVYDNDDNVGAVDCIWVVDCDC
jgi:hypothetical protein